MTEPVIDIRDRIEKNEKSDDLTGWSEFKSSEIFIRKYSRKKIDDDSFKKEDKDQSELLEKYQKKSLDNLNENITEKKKNLVKASKTLKE